MLRSVCNSISKQKWNALFKVQNRNIVKLYARTASARVYSQTCRHLPLMSAVKVERTNSIVFALHHGSSAILQQTSSIHTSAICHKKSKRKQNQVKQETRHQDDADEETDFDDFDIRQLLDEEDDLSDAVATHPIHGHKVFVLQPDIKSGHKKPLYTNAQLQFQEAVSLAESVLDWKVVDGDIYSTKNIDKKHLFGKGTFEEITERLKAIRGITAVFVSVEKLTPLQHKELEETWHLEVLDRYENGSLCV